MFGLVVLIASNVFPDQVFAGLQRITNQRGPQGIETAPGLLRLQQSETPKKPKKPAPPYGHALLPKTEAQWVSKLCSRPSPKFEGMWEPTQADVSALESNLPRVTKLQRNLENQECKIDDPYQFYRQYVGIVVRGRREIYVNAFSFPTDDQWLTQFVRICDGGGSVWGALYDPSTGKFHDLETNGGL